MAFDIPMAPRPKDYNTLAREALENRMQELKNQYYGQDIESQMGLRNAQSSEINKLLPGRIEELGLKNKWYGPNIQAEIAQRNSLTNRVNTMLPGEAQELAIRNMFGKQREQADIEQKIAQARYMELGGSGASASGHDRRDLIRTIALENPKISNNPSKLNEIASAYLSGENKLPDGTPLKPPSGLVNSIINPLNLRQDTSAGNNQKRFADTLETLFKLSDKNAEKAFQFVGLAGKTKKGLDILLGQTDKNDPNYVAYNKFINEDVPAMVTEIIRTSGANSTNAQKAVAFNQAFNDNLISNPEVARENYSELKTLYRAIGKTISKSITQRNKDLSSQSNQNNNVTIWNLDENGNLIRGQ